jgi:nucleolar protein 15
LKITDKTSVNPKSKLANTSNETSKASQSSKLHSIPRKRSADSDGDNDGERAKKRLASISKPKKKSKTQMASEENNADDSSDDNTNVVADQAAALLAGFETESSSSDSEGLPLDQLPPAPAVSKSSNKQKSKDQEGSNDGPGTLYVGRIPHGFYEPQMREYFSQFGTVTKLRLAKNKKTGRSKHYAFVEFESAKVADIVARTMDKYLLFGHILQVRVVPQEQVHPNLWKNAGKRFKVIPRAKMQATVLRQPQERKTWERRVQREEKRRLEKSEKLKKLGYDFDMPKLKPVKDVPMRKAGAGENKGEEGAMMKDADSNVMKAIEATPAAEETVLSSLLSKSQPTSGVEPAAVKKQVKMKA